MKSLSSFNEIETRLHMLLDSLSNGETVNIPEELFDKAAEEFKAALKRQFQPEIRSFRLRASNIGKPLCQLQMEQIESESNSITPQRKDYNHVIRMLIGDATETVVAMLLNLTGLNITGAKNRIEHAVNDFLIKGENDIEIDGKIWDIKSCSSWAFSHKWSEGWNELFYNDPFGYVDQLFIYAGGIPERMGGWIVVDKSSGEIKVIEAAPNKDQLDTIRKRIDNAEQVIRERKPFRRLFEEEDETWYKKPTGNKLVPNICTWCPFMQTCWPDAKRLPKANSKANPPPMIWYTQLKGTED